MHLAIEQGARAPGEVDDLERLSADDLATRREAELTADALALQRRRAATALRSTPGVCTNCGEPCLPTAVFCDADCRADHERREATIARRGAA